MPDEHELQELKAEFNEIKSMVNDKAANKLVDELKSRIDKNEEKIDNIDSTFKGWKIAGGIIVVVLLAIGIWNFFNIGDISKRLSEANEGINKLREKIIELGGKINELEGKYQVAKKRLDEIDVEIEQRVIAKIDDIANNKLEKLLRALPVGTIISSMLPEDKFKEALGDQSKKWILADGRNIGNQSEYTRLTNNLKVPDLRGMFLRGAGQNAQSSYQYRDGNDAKVGQMFRDGIVDHKHDTSLIRSNNPDSGPQFNILAWRGPTAGSTTGSKTGGAIKLSDDGFPVNAIDETRPKFCAINFYIKISN